MEIPDSFGEMSNALNGKMINQEGLDNLNLNTDFFVHKNFQIA